MTLYQATNGTRPIPGTLAQFASVAVLKGIMAGWTVDGWKQTTAKEMEGEIHA